MAGDYVKGGDLLPSALLVSQAGSAFAGRRLTGTTHGEQQQPAAGLASIFNPSRLRASPLPTPQASLQASLLALSEVILCLILLLLILISECSI